MSTPKVSLSFAFWSDAELDAFTENVISSLTSNPHYTTPEPALTAVSAMLDAFTAALAAAAGGGKAATAAKNKAREDLLSLLRPLAAYVQANCQGELSILLTSGFDAISTNRAQSALPRPAIRDISNGMSTQLTLRVDPVLNAKAYEVRYSSAPNTWQAGGVSPQGRRIVVESLTPGTLYSFQVRAVGGTTGHSDWSDSVSHMAT